MQFYAEIDKKNKHLLSVFKQNIAKIDSSNFRLLKKYATYCENNN